MVLFFLTIYVSDFVVSLDGDFLVYIICLAYSFVFPCRMVLLALASAFFVSCHCIIYSIFIPFSLFLNTDVLGKWEAPSACLR